MIQRKNETKGAIDLTGQYKLKRSMLHLCVHNAEWWNKHIGDPKLFINKMAAEGIYL